MSDLEHAADAAGVRIGTGDILLLRTGYLSRWWPLTTPVAKANYMSSWPGIGRSTVPWLAEREVAAVACDTVGLEVAPSEDGRIQPLHEPLIVDLGMTLGELWDLDALAADCASDGVHEFLLVAPPLHLPGGVGSPLNPIAIK